MNRIFRYLIQGILYTAPLAVTVYILFIVFDFLDGILRGLLVHINWDFPGIGLAIIAVFLITYFTTRYVAVASMVAAAALPILTHLGARFHKGPDGLSLWQAGTWNKPLFAFTVVTAILAIWKHRTNIQRLLNGTEHRFGKTKS